MIEILFRCDASHQIGSGHVIRCRTLARSLVKAGFKVGFVCRHLDGDLRSLLRKEFWVGTLDPITNNAPPLVSGVMSANSLELNSSNFDQKDDAYQTAFLIEKLELTSLRLIIVDHYQIDAVWEEEILCSRLCEKIKLMVIDDLANRKHTCDVFLDQNWDYRVNNLRYESLLPDICLKLMGPTYCLLDPLYLQARSVSRERKTVKNIFIYFGAYDLHLLTYKAVEALDAIDLKSFTIDVVLDPLDDIQRKKLFDFKSLSNQLVVHKPSPNLIPFLLKADFSIGAGGTTTWERACLGVPCLSTVVAENQEEHAIFFNKKLPMDLLNLNPLDLDIRLTETLLLIEKHPTLLTQCSNVLYQLVDGYGVHRVTAAITHKLESLECINSF